MGLFSNNKKLCPICGSPTPRLLATKVEDMPLCKECAGKVDLPDGVLERMSLDQFKKYIAYYDENQALRDAFKETDRMSFGFLSGELLADTEHRLLRLKGYDGTGISGIGPGVFPLPGGRQDPVRGQGRRSALP